MGCLESCIKSHEYEAIATLPDYNEENLYSNSYNVPPSQLLQMSHSYDTSTGESAFHNAPGLQDIDESSKDFDLNSPVFKGTVAEQKFSNKATYDHRFCWVSLHQRTINLSEHMNKDRRHKEASLADVVNVVAGPPEKYKLNPDEKEHQNINRCLTIKFVRGGGIDLRFKTEHERDIWYEVITRVVQQQSNIDKNLPMY